jgi:uncharacterized protein
MIDVGLMRVQDQAGILPAAEEIELARKSEALEKATTDQLMIITVPSLEGRTIEEVSLATDRSARLGVLGKDNGVLLLVAPRERKVRIETGRGIAGVLTDAEAASIVRAMIARFRVGQMPAGIEIGVNQIDRELRENPDRPALLRKDEPWPA